MKKVFQEVKERLDGYVDTSGNEYDAQIIGEIKACVIDLESSTEIRLPGSVKITRTYDDQTGKWTVTDNSTLRDELAHTVIATWCAMHIGNPPNHDNLLASYNSLKGQMRLSKRYTDFEGAGSCGR